jgi:hypothetical protein
LWGPTRVGSTICFSPFVAALGENLIRQLDVFPRRRWKMALDVRRARGAKIHFALRQPSDALCSRTWFASSLDNCDALISFVVSRTRKYFECYCCRKSHGAVVVSASGWGSQSFLNLRCTCVTREVKISRPMNGGKWAEIYIYVNFGCVKPLKPHTTASFCCTCVSWNHLNFISELKVSLLLKEQELT